MIVGPGYMLDDRKISAQRCVNLYLSPVETLDKARFVLESVPGLTRRLSLGETRCMHVANGYLYAVAGNKAYRIAPGWTATQIGTLATATGDVSIANGVSQVVFADGVSLYSYDLDASSWAPVGDADVFGRDTVDILENYFILGAQGQQFQISAANDINTVDGLDFASAEASPDSLVSHIVMGSELYLFGTESVEVWFWSGNTDFPFERNRSAFIDVGLYAAKSLRKLDGAAMFLGSEDGSSPSVYILRGYQARRISTKAVEQMLAASSDASQAVAYVYTRKGHKFYALNAPGCTTLVYDLLTEAWHERADLDDEGQYKAHRVTHATAWDGQNVCGGSEHIYTMHDDVFTFDGDEIVRERASPHDVDDGRDPKWHGEFILDARTGGAPLGVAPVVQLDWSNDGGWQYGNSLTRSLGLTGERANRLVWNRLGRSRDRVWRLRMSDAAPFSIIWAGPR